VALTATLASLAVLSLLLLLWQWIAALRFPLHRRMSIDAVSEPVTLLKPLKGCDSDTEECLRSWLTQDYAGPVQILFGVASADDPVCDIVRKLIQQYPAADARLVICGPLVGANAKVSKLLQLEQLAKHDLLVISDADVHVPCDLLSNLAASFCGNGDATRHTQHAIRSPGLVNCFYSLANPTTLAMHCEAIAINADFWTQVLQAQTLKPLDFALGAVMVTTRQHLQQLGGFAPFVNCLADDYQLGHRIARAGHQIVLATVPVECFSAPMSWSAVWKHQIRWARTIRVSQPVPYFFSILSNPTFWPLLWLTIAPTSTSALFAFVALLTRILMASNCQTRLTRKKSHLGYWWLVPVKDLLQVAIWATAFLGNTIEWRGQRLKLLPNGELRPAP